MAATINSRFFFGEFEIDADRRLLLRGGESVPIKAKTFDLLLTLVQNRGEVLSKNDLLDRVWENQFVEENNLTVHVAALRKALGETKNEHRYIVTVPGKGYRFVGDVKIPTNGNIEVQANGDVIVERRTLERVVVDETILESAPRFVTPSTKWIAAAILVIAGAGAATAIYLLGSDRFRALVTSDEAFANHTVRQLTTNGKIGQAALSPDGKLFAYTIDDLGQKALWLGYIDGGNHLMLREPSDAVYRGLTFSPDGSNLYFSLRDEKNPVSSLFSLPLMGGALTKVREGVTSFSLSPDGKQIASARFDKGSDSYVIFTAGTSGGDQRDLVSFPANKTVRSDSISWSPDGRFLSASGSSDGDRPNEAVTVVEIETGRIERIAHDEFREITETSWSADGSGIFITAVRPDSYASVPQYEVFHVAYPGGRTTAVTNDRSNYGASWMNDAGVSLSTSSKGDSMLAVEHRMMANIWVAPSEDLTAARQITFSSFGKCDGFWGLDWDMDGRIVYTTSDTRSQVISVMNADGTGQTPLTNPGYYDSVLTVSRDGKYVYFHSNRGGATDVWRMDVGGGNLKQLTFGGQGYHPAPSNDGRWVFYLSAIDNRGKLCRVPVDGGAPECLNENSTSFGSFSPDGQYFAAQLLTDKRRLAIFSAGSGQLIKQFDLPKAGTFYMGSRWTPDSKAVAYRDAHVGYWMQNIDGGEPRRIEGLPDERLYNFSWSKDGKLFAFVRGHEVRDVVLFQTSP